ncbi:hypothetical protein FISHEDRAFT_73623 [Fistulina hepatica ATCC 64428]|uniref:Uncharacterized protein n=1 Tax=Fistulina hepatica ATCC 64428 TaxID=1128425 RepID=A0A0D7AEX8_9AGAR|nr:hypothetical protein FISHEDRAFT_73623 [Fistulina hepatica ATCC 64428]
MSTRDSRFVEIKQINIADSRGEELKAEFLVIIKHERGTKETFKPVVNGTNAVAECGTFVKLGVSGATLQIYKDGKLKKKHVADVSLSISPSHVRKHKLEFGERLKLTLALGDTLRASEVAERRCREAQNALETSKQWMEKIDFVTSKLRLIMELGFAISQINPIAQVVFAAAKFTFDRVDGIPATYMELKVIALECLQDIKLDEMARKTYKSKAIRGILDDLMNSIIEALELISRYYSQSSIKTRASQLLPSNAGRVKALTRELRQKKETRATALSLAASPKTGWVMSTSFWRAAEPRTAPR